MGSAISSKHSSICRPERAMKSAILIQRWYRRYIAQLDVRRQCTWSIFQSIEYIGEQDQIKLYAFFNYLMEHFTPSSNTERDFICRMLTEEKRYKDTDLEEYCDLESIEVSNSYTGLHLTFPLMPDDAVALVETFKQKQLLLETRKYLKQLPNIKRISTCYSKEVTICGDLHGSLDDLFLIFYKNGLPSPERPYVFNGDFVDRGKQSIEVLLILFAFLLVYPKEVHLNRGNHEDYMVNLRYGFTKEVMEKYKVHGKKILKMLQSVFSWLPLATLIDEKVLVTHGGVSDTTDLELLSKIQRHKFVSTLHPSHRWVKKRNKTNSWPPPRSGSFTYGSSVSLHSKAYKGKRSASSPTTMTIDRKEIAKRVRRSVQEELEKYRRQLGFFEAYTEPSNSGPMADSESSILQDYDMDSEERKQVGESRIVLPEQLSELLRI